MYDYLAVLPGLDRHWPTILPCIAGAIIFSFIYFTSAVRQSLKEMVYVETFLGASVFFWHDGSYVLHYDLWFNHYNHWWFKAWWFALIGTAGFEAYLIYLFYKFGHKELWPSLSRGAFGALVIAGTLAVGTFWFLLKGAMQDDLSGLQRALTGTVLSGARSEGVSPAKRVAAWQESIRQAMRDVRERSGARAVSLVGLRLGALLAASVACDKDVAALALIAPVLSGRAYARELLTLARMSAVTP